MQTRRLFSGSALVFVIGSGPLGRAQEAPSAPQPYPGPTYPAPYQEPSGAPPPEPGYPEPAVPAPPGAAAPDEYGPAPESPAASYAETDPRALTDFRGVLDAYGNWVDDPTYGTVWVPSSSEVGSAFQPYLTAGRWAYDGGWTWLSEYPWGWVPFHYGRWAWISNLGWAWVPGRTYSGAWVDWRLGNGYVGWAPLPPRWTWHGGMPVALETRQNLRFVFSRQEDIFAPRIVGQVVSGPAYVNRTAPYVQVAPPVRTLELEGREFGPKREPAYRTRAVLGPTPTALGIPSLHVFRPTAGDPGLVQARRYATPAPPRPNLPSRVPPTRVPPPARRVR
jgi:hypothetical protein